MARLPDQQADSPGVDDGVGAAHAAAARRRAAQPGQATAAQRASRRRLESLHGGAAQPDTAGRRTARTGHPAGGSAEPRALRVRAACAGGPRRRRAAGADRRAARLARRDALRCAHPRRAGLCRSDDAERAGGRSRCSRPRAGTSTRARWSSSPRWWPATTWCRASWKRCASRSSADGLCFAVQAQARRNVKAPCAGSKPERKNGTASLRCRLP